MGNYPVFVIRRVFSSSQDFDEIFDAFEDALAQQIKDVELYRLLFWNHSLLPEELCLFGGKVAAEFPDIAYEVYIWLASIFESTYSSRDNYELALSYYRKAASVRPSELDPYLDAADCYEPDLNIPPLDALIEFLKGGIQHVPDPTKLYTRLGYLCELAGDEDESLRFRRLAQQNGGPGGE